jgi:hypothetical protein
MADQILRQDSIDPALIVGCRFPTEFFHPRKATSPHDETLLVGKPYLELFRSKGWTSVATIMQSRDVDSWRLKDGRENCRVTLQGALPKETIHGYLKRHWTPIPRWPIGHAAESPGMSEAVGVGVCQSLGIPTMEVIAAGERLITDLATGRPISESFFLSRRIDATPGFELYKQWRSEGRLQEPAIREQLHRMTLAVAQAVRRLHLAGCYHQDLFWQHIYFTEEAGGVLAARIIDLQRLICPPAWQRPIFWQKDMEQLRFSMQRMRFSRDELRQWYSAYFSAGEDESGKLTPDQLLKTGYVRMRGLRRAARFALGREKIRRAA